MQHSLCNATPHANHVLWFENIASESRNVETAADYTRTRLAKAPCSLAGGVLDFDARKSRGRKPRTNGHSPAVTQGVKYHQILLLHVAVWWVGNTERATETDPHQGTPATIPGFSRHKFLVRVTTTK